MLKPKQQKCVELMSYGNLTQKEIASEIGVSEATICNWKKNAEFIAAYTAEMKKIMMEAAAVAFNTLFSLLSSRNDAVRLGAAKDILDRAGFKPDDNINLACAPVVIVNDLKV